MEALKDLEVEVITPEEETEIVDLTSVLGDILSTMEGIADRMEAINETQAEILEKLDNLGLPGSGFTEYES